VGTDEKGHRDIRAEPAIAADGAGKMAFRGMKSLQPAPLLNWVVRRLRENAGHGIHVTIGTADSGGFYMSDDLNKPVELGDDEKALLVEKKATCPFIGSAVAQGKLQVLNDANDPLASIEEVRRLGNSPEGSGSDLGDLLVLFASGNHAFMQGDSEKLDKPVPSGLFSLQFPGSQGSHPGHSRILEGDDPKKLDSGRLSTDDFARLTSRAQDGLVKRSDVGSFIAENLLRDPNSKVNGANVLKPLGADAAETLESLVSALKVKLLDSDEAASDAHRDLEEKLTKALGEDNLVGSAGEYGLLFAFLANKPDAKTVEGEPALDVGDLKAMFVDKHLPDGWENWKKSRKDWVTNTVALVLSAHEAYEALRRTP
jgi:hypothetical protein